MRRPLTKPKPFGRAATATIDAPVKGLRSDKGLMEEQPMAALRLLNWVPETDAIRVRRGFEEFAFDLNVNKVETLMTYNSGTASKMFAAASTEIWDVSVAGDVGASAAVTSLTSAYRSWTNFTATGGTHYLVTANGADTVREYDGSSWSAPSITGATSANLKFVWSFKGRLWFIEKTSMKAWYLAVGAISGAATLFELGSLFKKGGKLIAGGTWSVDSDNEFGLDNMNVFVTDQGEVAVYQMSDPADPDSLLLKGVYDVGKPLGQRCLLNLGGDLLILTYKGLIPLSKAVAVKKEELDAQAVTSPIRKKFSDDALLYGSLTGWDLQSYPQANLVILNVPITVGAEYKQYVVNVLTGAWAEWTGINAVSWALFSEALYFGGIGEVVYKAESGSTDDGAAITAEVLTTYSNLGRPIRAKTVVLIKPIAETNVDVSGGYNILVDYEAPMTVPGTNPTGASPDAFTWDVSDWDEDVWEGSIIDHDWIGGSNNTGNTVAIHYAVNVASDANVDLVYRLIGFEVAFLIGGPLGG